MIKKATKSKKPAKKTSEKIEVVQDVLPKEEEIIQKPADVAEIYDEIIAQEQEREIIKNQRKMTAGKDAKKPAKKPEKEFEPIKIDLSKPIEIPDFITVKELAEKTGIKLAKIIGELMKNGILANINQQIDFDTAQIITDDLGIKLKRRRAVGSTEEFLTGNISDLLKEDDQSLLKERPPVVVVMGHVDHGKTKLLDAIRHTDVVSKEAGAITQHIGAYQVQKKGKMITFLDTPGHEAFTAMRARGAKVTDIAILVVAADEGVKPQTVEALNHAKEAGVPIIVAINKIDKPNANLDKVKAELSEHGLQPEEWGGKTVMVPVSALTGDGIDDLLEMVLLTAEMLNLKANSEREAIGTVIEANLDSSMGPVATVLINTGTLKVMDNVIIGNTFGRIKSMKDHNGKPLKLAPPSTPVRIAGLHETPRSGDILQVVKNERTAKQKAYEIHLITQQKDSEKMSGINQLISNVKSEKVLKIVVKADMKGSLEAIKDSIAKIKDEEVAIKIIHGGVGSISKSDVMMASASKGMVVGFHTDFDAPNVKKIAERENVEVKKYTIIYDLLEDVKRILSGLLAPEITKVVLGRAIVKQVFLTKRNYIIVGCRVVTGKIEHKAKLTVIRGKDAEGAEKVIGGGIIDSLKKVDQDAKEAKMNDECGVKFIGDTELHEGDILEAYKEEESRRSI